ncbi:hypothetical protein [Flavisolibacter tropicus]|uniref:Uncharacterized protein n=1 Tax=Flavisolibacter tropicus TaxID=1492898 RepID=A0A172TV20_9BACT|nr:hypothetical protein [Flavisolibacter tropicus]ANE50929.1 hypothetical protein SY85_10865 [Flavisolibacter tropicus]
MIPFSELRIGNYVLVNTIVRKIVMVSSIEDKKQFPSVGYYVGAHLQNIGCDSKYLQALPLTVNILEESGFSFDNYFKLWQKAKTATGTGMEMELDREFNVVDFMRRPLLKEVKSMHRLQNLYHALLDRELALEPVLAETY